MIQRIQSVWLVLAAVAASLTCKFSFFSGNIMGADNKTKIFNHLAATGNLVILILTVALCVMNFIAIFLYKNRKLQLRIVLAALIISIVNIGLYYFQAQKFVPGEGSYNITALLTLVVPIFLLLAAKGINSDQKLVKSLDRLR
jgi:Domain of unknown function (DUF4293)